VYKSQFDKINKLFKSYLFWGDSLYYIQKYTQQIASKLNTTLQKYYFEEYDFKTIQEVLKHSSLFGEINLVVIRNDKPLPKKELQTLISLTQKFPSSYLIYQLLSNEGKKITSLFKEPIAVEVRFFKPNFYEAKSELIQYAQKENIQIDEKSVEYLLYLVENDLERGIKELEKLSFEPITPNRIKEEVYPLNPLNLEELYIAILNKKPLSKILKKSFEQEPNALRILLGLQNFIKQLFLFNTHQKLHSTVSSQAVLGYRLPPSLEKEILHLSSSINNYSKLFFLLQECEYKLKTTTANDPQALLLSYLMKIQALI